MVGRMDIARCCCCDVIKPDFPYEEITGSWSAGVETNGVLTSDDDAKILFDELLDPEIPWRATVYVKVITNAASSTFSVRLIGGNEDPGTGYADGDGVYLRWGYDSNGQFFDLHGAKKPNDTSTCVAPWPDEIDSGTVTTTKQLEICWDGAKLTGKWNDIQTGKFLQAAADIVPIGDRFGFATETLSAGVVSVEFYDFHLYYVPNDEGGRASCIDCPPQHCCQGPVPAELVLEVAFQSENLTTVVNPSLCRGNCTNLDGTYYLSVGDCGGSLLCVWNQGPNSESAPCDPFAGFPTPPQSWQWYITAEMTTIGGDRAILVTFYSTAINPSPMVRLYALTDDPCEDWTDWITLTKYDGTCDLALYGNARIKVA